MAWPVAVVGPDGQSVDLAVALGPGGDRVASLLDCLLGVRRPGGTPDAAEMAELARGTPAGRLELPVTLVPLAEAAALSRRVDGRWLKEAEERRSAARPLLEQDGRAMDLEAALHVSLLLATERLEPPEHEPDASLASGAQLWLLGGAVAWALVGHDNDPFGPWAELLARGLWPVGPCDGQLVVGAVGRGSPVG